MKKISLFLMALLILSVPLAYADWNTDADSGDYLAKAPAMAARGIVNAVTSPGYLIEDMMNGCKAEGCKFTGVANGFATGLGKMLFAAGAGAWDFATAVLPNYRGAGYQHGMWPNYKW